VVSGRFLVSERVVAVIAVLLAGGGLLSSACQVRFTDVTEDSRFAGIRGACFELVEDAFVFRWADTGFISVETAGAGSNVPVSFEDYELHRANWYRSPAYLRKWGQAAERPDTVLALAKKGVRFTVTRIVEEDHPEAGTFIHPYAGFTLEGQKMIVDAKWLFEKYRVGRERYKIHPNPQKLRLCQGGNGA
jgi:hypothetical protein